MTRSYFFSYKAYNDDNGDGCLDIIYLGEGSPLARGLESESRIYYRKDDLENHPDIFARGEQEYREQLRRFGLPTSVQL